MQHWSLIIRKQRAMNLPLHLEALLETATSVQIIDDNARLPAQSATDEYYRNMSLSKHTRREQHVTYISPLSRRRLRVGAKSPSKSSPSSRQRPSVRSSLQHSLPAMPFQRQPKKISRWDNSSSDGDVSQESSPASSAQLLKMPVRSWSSKKNAHASPTVPIRRGSLDQSLSKVIDDLQLVFDDDDSDDDDDGEEGDYDDLTNSTTTINTLSPGPELSATGSINEHHPLFAKQRMLDHRSHTAPAHQLSDESTSTLLRRVIDDLKLYDDSESNIDANCDDDDDDDDD